MTGGDSAGLPGVLLAGVPRAGTTFLHDALVGGYAFASGQSKELRYLFPKGHPLVRGPSYHDGGWPGYAALFSGGGGECGIDSTPDYFFWPEVAGLVAQMPSRPLVVVSLRDPVDRLVSYFTFARDREARLPSDLTFAAFAGALLEGRSFPDAPLASAALEQGRYVDYLDAWGAVQASGQFLLVRFEDVVTTTDEVAAGIAARVGAAPRAPTAAGRRQNASATPRSRALHRIALGVRNAYGADAPNWVRRLYWRINDGGSSAETPDAATIAALRDHYEPTVLALEEHTGWDLRSWRPS